MNENRKKTTESINLAPVAVLRTNEISLKGGNRHIFEKKLAFNIKKTLKNLKISYLSAKRLKGRVIVFFDDFYELEKAKNAFNCVFGVSNFSAGVLAGKNLQDMENAIDFFSAGDYEKFRITVKRQDKRFPMNSMEVERELGSFVVQKYSKKVDLKNYDREFLVEVCEDETIVSVETIPGPGGLPVGTGGRTGVFTDNKNFELAAYYMMKRGCEVVFFGKQELKYLFCFNCFLEPKMIEQGEEEILGTMTEENLIALVSGSGPERINEIKKKYSKELVLFPLVGLTEKEIDEKQKGLSKTASQSKIGGISKLDNF